MPQQVLFMCLPFAADPRAGFKLQLQVVSLKMLPLSLPMQCHHDLKVDVVESELLCIEIIPKLFHEKKNKSKHFEFSQTFCRVTLTGRINLF